MAALIIFSYLALFFLLGLSKVESLTKPTSVKLIDNAYTGVVVGIHRDVEESDELIDAIKDMFIEGSFYLYNSTRRRAFFQSVTILIPTTWSKTPEYQQAKRETYDNADILIASEPNPLYQTDPYTKQYQGCGKRGVNINFIDQFFLDPNAVEIYGSRGRTLVHEWGHYWWGLFDEYPDKSSAKKHYQEFYLDTETGKWEGNRCSLGYEGRALKFGDVFVRECNGNSSVGYEDGCVFLPSEKGINATGSIMYGRQFYEQVVNFCDKDESDPSNFHNIQADNKQNRLCDRRSAWQVMRDTSDFKGNNNPARKIDPEYLIPTFILKQQGLVRVVLVLDVSGSMRGPRLTKMISACLDYIISVALVESYVGVIQFNDNPELLSPLTLILTDEDRTQLIRSLPDTAEGGTCIGCGLAGALQHLMFDGKAFQRFGAMTENARSPRLEEVLGTARRCLFEDRRVRVLTDFGDPAGGVIILLSDGEDSTNTNFPTDDLINSLVDAGVVVNPIAISQSADNKMSSLAVETGGKFYYYSEAPGDTSLHDALLATVGHADVPETETRIQLQSNSYALELNTNVTDHVVIDSTIGNRTEFSFQWMHATAGEQGLDVLLTSPNGTLLDSSYEGYNLDVNNGMLSIKPQGRAQSGTWTFQIFNVASVSEEVVCIISSYPTNPNVQPIIVTSELSGTYTDFANGELVLVFAEVRQGVSPIIKADVFAVVQQPGGTQTGKFKLTDNGAGADITKYDGIYSAYFTQFTTKGFYGVKINVENNGTAIIVGQGHHTSNGRGIPNLDPFNPLRSIGNYTVPLPWSPPAEPTGEPAPLFTRTTSGGSTNVPEVPPNYVPGMDIIPPGNIMDLNVAATSFDNQTVTLTWTSTGDDADFGTVQFYDIRRANTTTDLLNNFEGAISITQSDVVLGNLTSPKESGNTETFIIKVPIEPMSTAVTFALALKAVDDVSLMSDVSNNVQTTLRQYIPPTTIEIPTSTKQTPTPPLNPVLPTTVLLTPVLPTSFRLKQSLTTGQIVGIVVAHLLVVFLIVLVIFVFVICPRIQKCTQEDTVDTERQGRTVDTDQQGQTNVVMSTNDETPNVSEQHETDGNTYVNTPF